MKIRPRKELLDIWAALLRVSGQGESWVWQGEPGIDSVVEAQQLLCLMGPAVDLPMLRLERPDSTNEQVLTTLESIGRAREIPQFLTGVLTEYLERHSDNNGNPTYSGGDYFIPLDPDTKLVAEQRSLEVTESFALSVTLTLAILGFVKTFRQVVTRADLGTALDKLEALANKRLTGALIGLVRGFSIYTFDKNDSEGMVRIEALRQGRGVSDSSIVGDLQREMEDVVAGLRNLTMSNIDAERLEGTSQLFECGWSWGVVKGAAPIEELDWKGPQSEGFAEDAPYLYFTTVALDGVADLFSVRTRMLGLLDDDQSRLARELQLRWDLTQRYWATLATFGERRWLVEDPPWTATDGVGSDYFSLMVSAIATRDMVTRRASDSDLSRLGGVLSELAKRTRITRRPETGDHSVTMHYPGFKAGLGGSEQFGGPRLSWTNVDFSAVLLKRTLGITSLIRDVRLRADALLLVDDLWEHLVARRIGVSGDAAGLWDEPEKVFPLIKKTADRKKTPSAPSWQQTFRVVESLVIAAKQMEGDPPRSEFLTRIARESQSEAEHLYDQELLRGGGDRGPAIQIELADVEAKLARARRINATRPATAHVLVQDSLRQLNALAAPHDDRTN